MLNRITTAFCSVSLALVASTALAAPRYLITYNTTDVQSNAYIAGSIASTQPTPAYTTNQVPWFNVRMICLGHIDANRLCPATIKMATNTANPITLGNVYLNMDTGQITPSSISGNGFRMTVNGLGQATLSRE